MKTNKICAILGNIEDYAGLKPLTDHRPLATLPFDCKYRLIDFSLSSIANAHINTVFMVFNEGETQSVFDHIRSGKEWNLDALQNSFFTYFYQQFRRLKEEGKRYYGACIDYLKKTGSEYTIIMGTRMLCNIDIRTILQYHQAQGKDITVVYKSVAPEFVGEDDIVLDVCEDGFVQTIKMADKVDRSAERLKLAMGIYLLKTNYLIDLLEQAMDQNETEILPLLIQDKLVDLNASTFEYTGYLSNIFNVQSYYKANMDMLQPAKFNSLLYTSQKIYTKVKNEVPTYYAASSVVNNSQFATGCIIEGTVENSLIFRRVNVLDNAAVRHSIVMSGGKILSGATVEYAILDKNVIVAPNVIIRGTPDNPVVIEKETEVRENIGG